MVFCGEENSRNSNRPRCIIINEVKYVELSIADNVKRLIQENSIPSSTTDGLNTVSVNECHKSIPDGSYSEINCNSEKPHSDHDCQNEKNHDNEGVLYIDCDSPTSENISKVETLNNENSLTTENNDRCNEFSCEVVNFYQKHIGVYHQNVMIPLDRSKCFEKASNDVMLVAFKKEKFDASKAFRQKKDPKYFTLWFANSLGPRMVTVNHFPLTKFNKEISETTDLNNSIATNEYKEIEECPYCNFKISKSNFRHLLYHIRVCFCVSCKKVMSVKEAFSHVRGGICTELRCLKCPFKSNCEKKLHKHIISLHRDSLIRQCGLCGYKTLNTDNKCESTLTKLKEHVQSEHCVRQYPVTSWFILIEYNEEYQDLYHCPNCSNEVYSNFTDLLDHVSECQLSKKHLKCELCKFKHRSKVWMKLHKQTHSIRKYNCPHCKYRTMRHFMLKYHMMKNHKNRIWKRTEPKNSSSLKKRRKLN